MNAIWARGSISILRLELFRQLKNFCLKGHDSVSKIEKQDVEILSHPSAVLQASQSAARSSAHGRLPASSETSRIASVCGPSCRVYIRANSRGAWRVGLRSLDVFPFLFCNLLMSSANQPSWQVVSHSAALAVAGSSVCWRVVSSAFAWCSSSGPSHGLASCSTCCLSFCLSWYRAFIFSTLLASRLTFSSLSFSRCARRS